jgi:hypothetical protein
VGEEIMTNHFPRVLLRDGNQGSNYFLGPAVALNMWNPVLAATLRWNAQACQGLGVIVGKWQDFVERRLKEDCLLMERLAEHRRADEKFHVFADFWHRAADDYGQEITDMTKLMARLTNKMVATSQTETEEAGESMSSLLKAA